MRSTLFLVSCISTFFFIQSCEYNVESELYPLNLECDTIEVSYSADILPIINLNCVSCHNGIDLEGGVSLESHSELQDYALNGNLLCAIMHDPDCPAMPNGAPQLVSCDINKIKAWINEGALEN